MQKASEIFGSASGGPVLWEAGKNYKRGQIVISPTDWQPYARSAAEGSGATDPAADTGSYTPCGGRPIKSVQRGVVISSNNHAYGEVQISPVNPAKTIITRTGGQSRMQDGSVHEGLLELVNGTTMRLTGNNKYTIAAFQVVEYY